RRCRSGSRPRQPLGPVADSSALPERGVLPNEPSRPGRSASGPRPRDAGPSLACPSPARRGGRPAGRRPRAPASPTVPGGREPWRSAARRPWGGPHAALLQGHHLLPLGAVLQDPLVEDLHGLMDLAHGLGAVPRVVGAGPGQEEVRLAQDFRLPGLYLLLGGLFGGGGFLLLALLGGAFGPARQEGTHPPGHRVSGA